MERQRKKEKEEENIHERKITRYKSPNPNRRIKNNRIGKRGEG
jgi:hypothetical protein